MVSFADRTRELQRRVGRGKLIATVTVSQVYAHYQATDGRDDPRVMRRPFRHPLGGESGFLSKQIDARGHTEFRDWVRHAFEGSTCVEGAKTTVAELIKGVAHLAPLETGDLRRSGSGRVTANNRVVYVRPADVPRIPEAALKRRHSNNRRRRAF